NVYPEGFESPYEKLKRHLDRKMHVLLIGVSGAGKTKTIFDIARHRKVIYFDCYSDIDFACLKNKCYEMSPKLNLTTSLQIEFERKVGRHVMALVCSRLLIWERLVECRKLDERDYFGWLCYQRSKRTQNAIKKVYLKLCDFDVSGIFESFYSNGYPNFYIAFDESQTMLEPSGQLHQSFRSFSQSGPMVVNGELVHPRTFYTFLVNYFNLVTFVPCLWSGTHLRLKDVSLYKTAACGKVDNFLVWTEFSFLGIDDLMKLARRFLRFPDVNTPGAHDLLFLIENVFYFLQGRPRLFFRFLERLVETQGDSLMDRILNTFENYFYEMTHDQGADNVTSFYSFWRKHFYTNLVPFVSSDTLAVTVSSTLIDLLFKSLLSEGTGKLKMFQSTVDLVSTSLVMLKKDNTYVMAEPMVIHAGLNYLSSFKANPIITMICDRIFDWVTSPQEKGRLVEILLAINLRLNPWWKNEIAKKYEIPDLGETPTGLLDLRTGENLPFYFIQSFNPDFNFAILPPEKAGPDFRYKHFFAYGKTTWTSQNVSTADSVKNAESMDYNSWYKSLKNINDEVKILANRHVSSYFHLRFEFPFPPYSSSSYGKTVILADQSKTILIDINHELTALLFSDEFVTRYKAHVKNLK
ncbi:hypothetical protein ROZALSC1DRAFT_25180, partial [Rozella allomycis CSF55]